MAFVMHILHWLAVDGTAAIVEFPGVLYRGGAEKKIREYLVANNYVDAVIQLPPDLFFGTTIATCVIVLKKSKPTNDVAFIDATAEFTRQGNKNKLTDDHQDRILDALAARIDVDHFVKVVANEDSAGERREAVGHLLGGGCGHPRGRSTSSPSTPRSSRSSSGRPCCGSRSTPSLRTSRATRERISQDLVDELCPDGVEYKTLG